MAYACPACKTPESIAALFTTEGATVFPCPECRWSAGGAGFPPVVRVGVRCGRDGCPGTAHDVYRTTGGALRLWHDPCTVCGLAQRPYARRDRRPAPVPRV